MSGKSGKSTIRDVAARAGVSYQTVSFVINETGVISEETRQRVMAAINELHYVPNPAARSLATGRTRVIALMIPDTENPHFWHHVKGVQDVASSRDFSVLLVCGDLQPNRERAVLRALAHQHYDGLILLPAFPELEKAEISFLLRQGKPVVGNLGPDFPQMDQITWDYDASAEVLMEHLLTMGHKRIGLIDGVAQPGGAQERVAAYQRGLTAAGITMEDDLVVHCGPHLADGYQAAEKLIGLCPRPTAIIGINDLMAFAALQASLRRDLRVPLDISIAGFDDILISSFLSPPLTTVQVRGADTGRRLAELLFDRLDDPDLPPRQVRLPAELVVRKSTGPAPRDKSSASSR